MAKTDPKRTLGVLAEDAGIKRHSRALQSDLGALGVGVDLLQRVVLTRRARIPSPQALDYDQNGTAIRSLDALPAEPALVFKHDRMVTKLRSPARTDFHLQRMFTRSACRRWPPGSGLRPAANGNDLVSVRLVLRTVG